MKTQGEDSLHLGLSASGLKSKFVPFQPQSVVLRSGSPGNTAGLSSLLAVSCHNRKRSADWDTHQLSMGARLGDTTQLHPPSCSWQLGRALGTRPPWRPCHLCRTPPLGPEPCLGEATSQMRQLIQYKVPRVLSPFPAWVKLGKGQGKRAAGARKTHNSGISGHLAPGRNGTSGCGRFGRQRLRNPRAGAHGSAQAGSEAGALAVLHLAYPVGGRGHVLTGLYGNPLTLGHSVWHEAGAGAPTHAHAPTSTHTVALSASLRAFTRKITHRRSPLPSSFSIL